MSDGKILDLEEYRKKVKDSGLSIHASLQRGEPGAFFVEDNGKGVVTFIQDNDQPPPSAG